GDGKVFSIVRHLMEAQPERLTSLMDRYVALVRRHPEKGIHSIRYSFQREDIKLVRPDLVRAVCEGFAHDAYAAYEFLWHCAGAARRGIPPRARADGHHVPPEAEGPPPRPPGGAPLRGPGGPLAQAARREVLAHLGLRDVHHRPFRRRRGLDRRGRTVPGGRL